MRAAARKAVVPKTRKKEAEERKAEKISRELESLRERVLRKEAELSNLSKRKVGDEDWDDLPNKRAKYLGNPFQAEKSSYDRRLLEINNPFVDIREVPELRFMPPDNVSDGKLMDEAAFKAAVDILLEPVAVTSRRFRTELGTQIVHASILQNIKLLTTPSSETDSQVVIGGKEQLQLKDLQFIEQESDEIGHEGDEGQERVGKVRDTLLDPANNLVTVIIIECDWKGTPTKLDQGAGYAIRAAKLNMKKGRYGPIYVHHWYKGGWRYGVLRPKGIVTVKDGTILNVHTAIQDLIYRQEEGIFGRFGVQYFRLNQFPDDEYVLGSLDFCATEMTLPVNPDKPIDEGGLLFFTSLIRTFIGDRALTLTSADIEDNHAKREASIKQTIDYFSSSLSATYSRMPSTVKKERSESTSGSLSQAFAKSKFEEYMLGSLYRQSGKSSFFMCFESCRILELITGRIRKRFKCPWLNAFLKRGWKFFKIHASRRTRSPKSVLAIPDTRTLSPSPDLALMSSGNPQHRGGLRWRSHAISSWERRPRLFLRVLAPRHQERSIALLEISPKLAGSATLALHLQPLTLPFDVGLER
ncbi:hypothetical protein SELMODRAFT_403679 [Selaginella moellendorffii]|uniref:Uncharacterized protein n=1 Tax=Selaginella moellendorffii TaxID=88036 RepID=D8QS67_SELML|nr:hypothetical protein SELMODRAFT_403679 [Selaginella moellendorffii]